MFAKIFIQIFDSSIAEDPRLRHFFMDMLVLADREGVVDMTPGAIAGRTRLPIEEVRGYLERLEQPDGESRSKESEGRRLVRIDMERTWGWKITNYEKYRMIASEEQRRDQTRVRVARLRAGAESDPTNNLGGNGVWHPTPEQLRVAGLFNRRPDTEWSEKEKKAWKSASPTEQDILLIEGYYRAKIPQDKNYRRRDLGTLLNNWTGELDRARNFKQPQAKLF
jgi:hypothetical protein